LAEPGIGVSGPELWEVEGNGVNCDCCCGSLSGPWNIGDGRVDGLLDVKSHYLFKFFLLLLNHHGLAEIVGQNNNKTKIL
jgi:hypothetical protein